MALTTTDMKGVLARTGYMAAAKTLAPILRDLFTAMPQRPQYKLEQMMEQPMPRKRRVKKVRKARSAPPVGSVPRSIVSRTVANKPTRIETVSFATLTNFSLNNVSTNLVLDLRTGAGTLGAWNGRLNTLGTLFAQWNLRKVVVTFFPLLSQNSTGTFAMAYEGDPSTAALANIGGIANKRIFTLGSITRDSPTLTWVNPDSGTSGNRFCIQTVNSVVKTLDEIGFGMIQFAGVNSEASGASIGNVQVQTVIDFWEMH